MGSIRRELSDGHRVYRELKGNGKMMANEMMDVGKDDDDNNNKNNKKTPLGAGGAP